MAEVLLNIRPYILEQDIYIKVIRICSSAQILFGLLLTFITCFPNIFLGNPLDTVSNCYSPSFQYIIYTSFYVYVIAGTLGWMVKRNLNHNKESLCSTIILVFCTFMNIFAIFFGALISIYSFILIKNSDSAYMNSKCQFTFSILETLLGVVTLTCFAFRRSSQTVSTSVLQSVAGERTAQRILSDDDLPNYDDLTNYDDTEKQTRYWMVYNEGLPTYSEAAKAAINYSEHCAYS